MTTEKDDMPDVIFAYYFHDEKGLSGLVDCYLFDSKEANPESNTKTSTVNQHSEPAQ